MRLYRHKLKYRHTSIAPGLLSRLLLVYLAVHSAISNAAELQVFHLILKDHLFFPSRLEVPAKVKFKLVIDNQDNTAEEFDSFDLNREKVIFGNRQSTIFVGPLKPGEYTFFGEYNSSTAQGVLIASDHLIESSHAD